MLEIGLPQLWTLPEIIWLGSSRRGLNICLVSYKASFGMGCCLLLGLFQNGPSTDRASNVTVEVGDNYFQWLEPSLTSDMSHPLAQSGSKPHRSFTREQDAFALWTFLPNQKTLRTDEKLCTACSFLSFVAPESVHRFRQWK